MKRRTAVAHRLFRRSRIARLLFVAAVYPVVWVADKARRIDPPVSWERGMRWVRDPDRLPYGGTIPTSTTPATVRPAPAPLSPCWADRDGEPPARPAAARKPTYDGSLFGPDVCRCNDHIDPHRHVGGNPSVRSIFEEDSP